MKFSINYITYKLKATWNEVTLEDAVKIVKLNISEEDLKELFITDDIEFPDHIMNFMVDVLVILSDCSKEIIENTDPIHVVVLFNEIKYIVFGLFYYNFETYKPKGVKEIVFQGIKYYMPESLIINNEEILFIKEPSKNVIEVSNLMQILSDIKKDGIELMNLIAAIYLREDVNEVYDEEKIAKRAIIFKKLPMSVILDVFFYTYYFLNNYLIGSRTYLENQKKIQKKRRMNSILGFFKWQNKVLLVL